jgi:hypothetical protein
LDAEENILDPKKDEVTRGWSKLPNEELHHVYSSPNIIHDDQIKETGIGAACRAHAGDKKLVQKFGWKH